MKILIVPDSFKESLSATQAAHAMARAVQKVLPQASFTLLPFSDGGEGAFELLTQAQQGKTIVCNTQDPLGRAIRAPYFLFNDEKTAWIELSQASGLSLLSEPEKNPLKTNTYGTGIQILNALDRGAKKIILGLGGSATHDMGMGIFTALGGKLLDQNQQTIVPNGENLGAIYSLYDQWDSRVRNTPFVMACDVTNPLLGPTGAAAVYAPQKGANAPMVDQLENNSAQLASRILATTGKDITTFPGGGAAGGTAAGLSPFLDAQCQSGFDLLAGFCGLEEKIKKADLILTGEGHLDQQSSYGKVVSKLIHYAQKEAIPVWAYAGRISATAKQLKKMGLQKAFTITPDQMDFQTAKPLAANFLQKQVEHSLKNTIKWG